MDTPVSLSRSGTEATAAAPFARYEAAVAQATGTAFAIAFGYARTGLAAILEAAGLATGDEVLLSPLTCKVVPLSLIAAGLKPVYVDIAADALNLDAERLEAAIGGRTRAVLLQHTYGVPAEAARVSDLCRERGLLLVEDCAQCVPFGRMGPGHAGRAAVYSNNLRKPVPAASGGVVTTDDAALAREIVRVRDRLGERSKTAETELIASTALQAAVLGPRSYWPLFGLAQAVGPIYRNRSLPEEIASEITRAAIRPSPFQIRRGLAWLPRVAALAEHRTRAAQDYAQRLRGAPGALLPVPEPSDPLYFFPVLADDKTRLLRAARSRLLEVVAWPLLLPIYPVADARELPRYGYAPGSCPNAEHVARRLVGLPTDFRATPAIRAAVASLIAASS